jgi:hypothetical protein
MVHNLWQFMGIILSLFVEQMPVFKKQSNRWVERPRKWKQKLTIHPNFWKDKFGKNDSIFYSTLSAPSSFPFWKNKDLINHVTRSTSFWNLENSSSLGGYMLSALQVENLYRNQMFYCYLKNKKTKTKYEWIQHAAKPSNYCKLLYEKLWCSSIDVKKR